MAPVFIPFTGWAPGGGYFGEGWQTVLNLYPHVASWRPWRRFVGVGSGVADGPMTGRHVHRWAAPIASSTYVGDAQTIFCGSPSKLYTVNPTTGAFTDLSRSPGAAYGAGAGTGPGGWRFADVGDDTWAANWFDVLQRRTNNTGNFADGVVSTFVPRPRFLATVREHLVVANLSNAGRFQDEVAWSDADNATNFDAPTATSTSIAGSKRLIEVPGQITGLVGLRAGAMVFKRGGIFFLYYTGTTQVFQPDLLSSSVGTAFPSSIINSRYGVFFRGPDGIYQITGVSAPVKISPLEVDEIIMDQNLINLALGAQPPYKEDLQSFGFQSAGLPLIGWLLRFQNYGSDQAVLYNPVSQQWSLVETSEIDGETLRIPSVVVERPSGANAYETLAALTWNEATTEYAPLSSSGADTLAATLELRWRPANFEAAGKHHQSLLKEVLPIFSKTSLVGAAITPEVKVDVMLDPFLATWGAQSVIPSSLRDTIAGWYPAQRAGRFFRVIIATTAGEDFSNFYGTWVDQDLLT